MKETPLNQTDRMLRNDEGGERPLAAWLREHFAILLVEKNDAEEIMQAFPYAAEDLLDVDKLRRLLEQQAEQLGGVSPDIAGTLFAKRYSVLIAGMFAAYTLYGKVFPVEPSAVRIRHVGGGVMAYAVFGESLRPRSEQSDPSDYAGQIETHIRAVLEAVSAASGASDKVLRSLVVHQVHTLYACLEAELLQESALRTERAERIRADHAAVKGRSGDWFYGRFRPIGEDAVGLPLLLRPYCCQAYRTSGSEHTEAYCPTCPKSGGSIR